MSDKTKAKLQAELKAAKETISDLKCEVEKERDAYQHIKLENNDLHERIAAKDQLLSRQADLIKQLEADIIVAESSRDNAHAAYIDIMKGSIWHFIRQRNRFTNK